MLRSPEGPPIPPEDYSINFDLVTGEPVINTNACMLNHTYVDFGIKTIKAVKKYLNNLDKKKFTVIFRKERFGMKKNWILAYDYMFKMWSIWILIKQLK